jgi:tripartite-type tricarboxylate transporter receptor subunit TctC
VINATLYDKLSFNFPFDIAPVASIAMAPLALLVNLSVPADTVPAFIVHAKANPGRITVASPGIGSPQHVSAELFKMMTGTNWPSEVPGVESGPTTVLAETLR